jgi:hypothetical protein
VFDANPPAQLLQQPRLVRCNEIGRRHDGAKASKLIKYTVCTILNDAELSVKRRTSKRPDARPQPRLAREYPTSGRWDILCQVRSTYKFGVTGDRPQRGD